MNGSDWQVNDALESLPSDPDGASTMDAYWPTGASEQVAFPYPKYQLPNILNPLKLRMPGDEDTPATRKAPGPEDIQAWLERHPTDPRRHTGREIQGLLRGLNLHHMLAARHLQCLVLLQPHVDALLDNLRSRYRNHPLPLDEKTAAHAIMARMVLEEMAVGYKLIVNDVICDLAEKSVDRQMFLFALQQAIVYIGQQLLECYIQYRREPMHLWGELHRLYQYAERNGCNTLPVSSLLPDSGTPPGTVQEAYLRVVLLALTQPNHLFSGHAEMIYRHLGQWAEGVTILSRGTPAHHGDMVIDLASEQPPRVVSRHFPMMPVEGRYLDISSLQANLQKLRNANPPYDKRPLALSERIHQDMLNRLCDAWRGRGERRSERILDGRTPVLTSAGLNAAHHLLTGEGPFAPENQELEWHAARRRTPGETARTSDALSVHLDDLERHSQTLADTGKAMQIPDDDKTMSALHRMIRLREQEQAEEKHAIEAWQRINHSHGGLALRRLASNRIKLFVGSLVAYRDDKDDQAWRVGVIRWLQDNGVAEFVVGIEALADNGHGVALRPLDHTRTDMQYFRALLIQLQAGQQALILPANRYVARNRLVLNAGGRFYAIELQDIHMTTNCISVFHFTQLS